MCKLLMNILDQVFKDNKTMADANATLYRFCDVLPTSLDLQKIVCFYFLNLITVKPVLSGHSKGDKKGILEDSW